MILASLGNLRQIYQSANQMSREFTTKTSGLFLFAHCHRQAESRLVLSFSHKFTRLFNFYVSCCGILFRSAFYSLWRLLPAFNTRCRVFPSDKKKKRLAHGNLVIYNHHTDTFWKISLHGTPRLPALQALRGLRSLKEKNWVLS